MDLFNLFCFIFGYRKFWIVVCLIAFGSFHNCSIYILHKRRKYENNILRKFVTIIFFKKAALSVSFLPFYFFSLQEEILKTLEKYIELSRSRFPRLYFLSNLEIVDLLGVSRNPQALVPYVRKCFPGIQNITFALPPGMGGLNSQLDFALNSKHSYIFVGNSIEVII